MGSLRVLSAAVVQWCCAKEAFNKRNVCVRGHADVIELSVISDWLACHLLHNSSQVGIQQRSA